MQGLSSVVTAITNRPQGAAALRETDDTIHTFAGDNQDLFLLDATLFNNVSSSAAAYTTATDDHWDIIQYGNRGIAVNGHTDQPQTFLMGTDTAFSNLAGSPPKAKHAAVINNFVMLGNINDATDGVVPNRVHWCAIDNPTSWPTVGTSAAAQVQSDRQDLPTGWSVEAITGAIGGIDGAIFMRQSIYRIQYEGAPAVFNFKEVERSRGTLTGKSVVNVGSFAFFLGEDGFYSFNGTQSHAIGNLKIDNFFFEDMDLNHVHRITAAANPINKTVYWSYPSKLADNGQPDSIIVYNWETGRWSHGDLDADIIFSNLTIGYDLEQLDSFGNMDTLTTSLDDRFWINGLFSLAAFDIDHKLSTFTGSALEGTITTKEFGGMELWQTANERMYVDGVRPYVDGGEYTVSLEYRDAPKGDVTVDGPNTVNDNGMANFTRSCRYARVTVTIGAGGIWSHAQGVDLDVDKDGEY